MTSDRNVKLKTNLSPEVQNRFERQIFSVNKRSMLERHEQVQQWWSTSEWLAGNRLSSDGLPTNWLSSCRLTSSLLINWPTIDWPGKDCPMLYWPVKYLPDQILAGQTNWRSALSILLLFCPSLLEDVHSNTVQFGCWSEASMSAVCCSWVCGYCCCCCCCISMLRLLHL